MSEQIGRRRFLRGAGATGVTMLGALPLAQVDAGCGSPPPPPVLLGVHPKAALQPTAWGRRLQDLVVFDGRVFAGYGDWGDNTGPIAIVGWDLAAGAWIDEGDLDTECTWLLRRVGGRLVAPFIDPKLNTGDLAVRSVGSASWTTIAIGPTNAASHHAFDVASLDGTDLWVAGAKRGTRDGVVWRSPSGLGGDWVEGLVVPSFDARWVRVRALVHHDGNLLADGYSFNNAEPFDPAAFEAQSTTGGPWSPAPGFSFDVGSGLHLTGHKPMVFDDHVVRLRSWPSLHQPTELLWYDGTSLRVGPQLAYDLTIDERGWLWYIDEAFDIRVSPSVADGSLVIRAAPPGASCIAVDGWSVFVGTTASELYRIDL